MDALYYSHRYRSTSQLLDQVLLDFYDVGGIRNTDQRTTVRRRFFLLSEQVNNTNTVLR